MKQEEFFKIMYNAYRTNSGNPFVSNDMNEMFDNFAKQWGCERYSEEYNKRLFGMLSSIVKNS